MFLRSRNSMQFQNPEIHDCTPTRSASFYRLAIHPDMPSQNLLVVSDDLKLSTMRDLPSKSS